MTNNIVGEQFKEFCDELFPPPPCRVSARTRMPATNPFVTLEAANKMSEDAITAEFITVVNKYELIPGMKMCYCGDRPDPAMIDPERQKPDTAFFCEDIAPTGNKTRAHWVDQLISTEFKRHANNAGSLLDPFEDSSDSSDVFPATAKLRQQGRAQIITYAELVMAVQQRRAVFMLVVIGRCCRFIRWDRSGSLVTQTLDYYLQWELFCDVLWRISTLSNEQLGYDPTATRLFPGNPDYELMDHDELSAMPTGPEDDAEKSVPRTEDGSDASATPPVFTYVRTKFRESINSSWPRYRLSVPHGDRMRNFLVSKPSFRAKGLIGRGTRGYIAFDCETERFVWLKDAWRAYYHMLEKEGDVLKQLNEGDVPHIPTVICHGDIGNQVTLTHAWWERKNPKPTPDDSAVTPPAAPTKASSSTSSVKRKRRNEDDDDEDDLQRPEGLPPRQSTKASKDPPLRPHRHYRLVVKEVALQLSNFQYGQQLVEIIRDCVLAHHHAYQLGIMHRDVSGGNILILPVLVKSNGGVYVAYIGILADWEMSKPWEKKYPRQPERTGTWQFMSVALLSRRKVIQISDELESFFYVLLYYAVRYLKSNCNGLTIANYLDQFFDQYSIDDQGFVCGTLKHSTIKNGELLVTPDKELLFHGPMDTLFKTLLRWFRANFRVTRHAHRQKELKTQREAKNAQPAVPPTAAPAPAQRPVHTSVLHPAISLLPSKRKSRGTLAQGDEPTPEEIAEAEALSEHADVYNLLTEIAASNLWTLGDKAGDQVPADWKVDDYKIYSTTLPTIPEEGSSKRIRLAGVETAPDPQWVYVSSGPPVTPPRRGQTVPKRKEL
ncbi:hypothetical protein C8Q80DRAFT_1200859 [Daedaleopsis nitida]|nr:hypothetical protein C8Q80DRAFT_1200859 [Daedaleopsis nitida]